jgi:transcriptional regulator with XRE-family HTH domain
MEKSFNSPEYARLIELLVAVRHAAGVRQQALAKKLGRPQSFIAKYEGGERRLDVVEFVAIAHALGADPIKLLRDFLSEKPLKSAKKRSGSKARTSRT